MPRIAVRADLLPLGVACGAILAACVRPSAPASSPVAGPAASVLASASPSSAPPSASAAKTSPPAAFSEVFRGGHEQAPTIAVLAKHTVLHRGALVLIVDGTEVRQDHADLTGIHPADLGRPGQRITGLRGPAFRKAFLLLSDDAEGEGQAMALYRPGARGFEDVPSPEGTRWVALEELRLGALRGVALDEGGGVRFEHLSGPENDTEDRGSGSGSNYRRRVLGFQRTPEGTAFSLLGENGAYFVERVRRFDQGPPALALPPASPVESARNPRREDPTITAYRDDLAWVWAPADNERGGAHAPYAVVFDGETWTAETGPSGRELGSFCVDRSGRRWAVASPRGVRLPTETDQVFTRDEGGAWQAAAIPPGTDAEAVVCDDPRGVWLRAWARDRPFPASSFVLARSAPVSRTVSLRDRDNAPGAIADTPSQPATSICKTPVVLLGSRSGAARDEEEARQLVKLLANVKLPAGRRLERFSGTRGAPGSVGMTFDTYAAAVAFAEGAERDAPPLEPQIVCAVPGRRAPFVP